MLDFCNLFSGTGTIGKKTNKNPQKPNPPTFGLQTLSLKVNTQTFYGFFSVWQARNDSLDYAFSKTTDFKIWRQWSFIFTIWWTGKNNYADTQNSSYSEWCSSMTVLKDSNWWEMPAFRSLFLQFNFTQETNGILLEKVVLPVEVS